MRSQHLLSGIIMFSVRSGVHKRHAICRDGAADAAAAANTERVCVPLVDLHIYGIACGWV